MKKKISFCIWNRHEICNWAKTRQGSGGHCWPKVKGAGAKSLLGVLGQRPQQLNIFFYIWTLKNALKCNPWWIFIKKYIYTNIFTIYMYRPYPLTFSANLLRRFTKNILRAKAKSHACWKDTQEPLAHNEMLEGIGACPQKKISQCR